MINFPRAEERLRPLLDTYVAIARQHTGNADFLPGPKTRRELYPAARDLAGELTAYGVGESSWGQFLWWAYRQMQKRLNENLTGFYNLDKEEKNN